MKPLEIEREHARRLVLQAQGLLPGAARAVILPAGDSPPSTAAAAALAAIEHLGYVQIDTISVVERAHHHVLWSRVPAYRPSVLDALVSEQKTVFEYWAHAASYLPMRDFRFSLPRKRLYLNGKRHWFNETSEHKKLRRTVLARLRAEGPLTSRDFEAPPRKRQAAGGWFERKPAKLVLEQLFMEGRLMSAGRRGFEKLYDLTENVLPSGVDTRFPTASERSRHLIDTSLRQFAIARPEEIAYLRPSAREDVRAECRRMLEDGELVEVAVAGIEKTYLLRAADLAPLERAAKSAGGASLETHLLSPFDNLVIQRKRLQELFGFDYLIECYVPAPKRKFGYFCLPILQGERLVGRIDAKAERERGCLNVRVLHLEKGAALDRASYASALSAFAAFNGCSAVEEPEARSAARREKSSRAPARP